MFEPEINIMPQSSSFNEIDLSSDDIRALTIPNQLNCITHAETSRPRSTSYCCSNRLELAFLMNSPSFSRYSEATKSVLIPYTDNSVELGVIKEEDKDITISFEEDRRQ